MAKLNIAERRLPQDGRIMLRVKGKEIDFRVSTVPTIHGESIVLRILDKSSIVLDIMKLGFARDTLEAFQGLIQHPHGIILVTGPTGSGKTTTLYCALEKINSPDKKIITVEDPVEYQLKGVNQIQVKPAINLTFANALRSIVRQDPDVILIGEIRDSETAEIAIHSALTGIWSSPPSIPTTLQRHHPPDQHGDGRLPSLFDHHRNPGAEAGAHRMPLLPGACFPGPGGPAGNEDGRRRSRGDQGF